MEDNVLFDPLNQEGFHHVVQYVEQAGVVHHMDPINSTTLHVECIEGVLSDLLWKSKIECGYS